MHWVQTFMLTCSAQVIWKSPFRLLLEIGGSDPIHSVPPIPDIEKHKKKVYILEIDYYMIEQNTCNKFSKPTTSSPRYKLEPPGSIPENEHVTVSVYL